VKTPGHGHRAQEGDLDAFGVERGVGWPRVPYNAFYFAIFLA
jgi:hypothetical protein